ncbi:unnamed protein product [Musa acuminata subsp. burmannicoides]
MQTNTCGDYIKHKAGITPIERGSKLPYLMAVQTTWSRGRKWQKTLPGVNPSTSKTGSFHLAALLWHAATASTLVPSSLTRSTTQAISLRILEASWASKGQPISSPASPITHLKQ